MYMAVVRVKVSCRRCESEGGAGERKELVCVCARGCIWNGVLGRAYWMHPLPRYGEIRQQLGRCQGGEYL